MKSSKCNKIRVKVPESFTGDSMTAEEYRLYADGVSKEEKKLKYRNVISKNLEGVTFRSNREKKHYALLELLKLKGEIKDFQFQVPYKIVDAVKGYGRINGKTKEFVFPARHYIADFVVEENDGTIRVQDTKSPATKNLAVYRLKKQLMLIKYKILIEEI